MTLVRQIRSLSLLLFFTPTTFSLLRHTRATSPTYTTPRYTISQDCPGAYYCKLNHSVLDVDEDYYLRYVRREHSCVEKGRCRRLDCLDGHVCQREACAKGVHKSPCSLMHRVDYAVAKWVKPDDGEFGSDMSSPDESKIPEFNLIDL
jgi:hypothetical protein